jgi:hypothetical protein
MKLFFAAPAVARRFCGEIPHSKRHSSGGSRRFSGGRLSPQPLEQLVGIFGRVAKGDAAEKFARMDDHDRQAAKILYPHIGFGSYRRWIMQKEKRSGFGNIGNLYGESLAPIIELAMQIDCIAPLPAPLRR